MDTPDGGTIFWHRRDLRTRDNRGLGRAGRAGPVIPVYVLDPTLLDLAGPGRTAFFLDGLADLQAAYRDLGSDLLVRWGDPEIEIPSLAAAGRVASVVWNQDYSRYARDRDLGIVQELEDDGIRVHEEQDMTLHEPGSILTGAGEHYSVFSYYYKKWADRSAPAPSSPPPDGSLVAFEGPDLESVLGEHGLDDLVSGGSGSAQDGPGAGRRAALDRLDRFVDGPIYEYAATRDIPAAQSTSRLSQDLKFGLLGIREVFDTTVDALERAVDGQARESVESFQRQLAWRDFYVQVLAARPDTVWENFKQFENPIQWRSDPAALGAWKRGETGFPIVDAGMGQLLKTGYMHNRVRMIVASFLTKDLQIDWREGYRWFRTHLVDHETANDVGGWQWAASTGTDAQPYFRIFNPMTQGERYDPDAEYIRKYVPELSGVDPTDIHRWDALSEDRRDALAPGYTAPIVDHAARRESAIDLFEAARGTD